MNGIALVKDAPQVCSKALPWNGRSPILERPEVLSRAWRHCTHTERHQGTSKSAKRHIDVLRAA